MHTTEQLNRALDGRYAVERLVGQGGMAVVYVARDIKHGRRVALKVLSPDLGALVGVERFLSEIQVTAKLQHPNLLPLFDSGAAGELLYYVMPYVEGESLRARLEREKQLPVDEAVRIATAVASALDYAHRHGVIHRDLKPENILLHEGQPLVADFGIALAISNAGGNRITQTGLSLGTPQYMSPEQATGDRVIDGRTDVYSLGAVTYELLVGEPPHTGSTSQAIIARLLTESPRPIHVSRPQVPEHVQSAVERALAKLSADRWGTGKEFADAMAGVGPGSSGPRVAAASRRATPFRDKRVIAALATTAVVAAAVAVAVSGGTAPAPSAMRFDLPLTDSLILSPNPSLALSSDGKTLAFTAWRGSQRGIFVRELGDLTPRFVQGTEGGTEPRFAPDGRTLAFRASGTLYSVPVEGGGRTTIVTGASRGMVWSDDTTVFFGRAGSIWRVRPSGGEARLVASPDSSRGQRALAPSFALPGGAGLLIHYWTDSGQARNLNVAESRIAMVTPNGTVERLGLAGADPVYVPSGHLLFWRDGIVHAAPFTPASRAVGAPFPVFREVTATTTGAGFTIGGAVAAHVTGLSSSRLAAVDWSGRVRDLSRPFTYVSKLRLSPDGRHVAIERGTGTGRWAVWVYTFATGAFSRLTADGAGYRPGGWLPNGKDVVYVGTTGSRSTVSARPWDGSADARTLLEPAESVQEVAVSPRDNRLAFSLRSNANGSDIYLSASGSTEPPRPLAATPAEERGPQFSPDGRLLSFTSTESGRPEVHVMRLSGPPARVQVSDGGGEEATWTRDGQWLVYRSGSMFLKASVKDGVELTASRSDTLFEASTYYSEGRWIDFAVMPGGRELLVIRTAPESQKLVVTVNWQSVLDGAAPRRP